MIVAGMLLVGLSVYVAQLMRLRESFTLDWKGTQIPGTVEKVDAEHYRVRFELVSGIRSQVIKGKIPLYQRLTGDGPSVTVVYDPANATNFQIRGQSYPATAIVGGLFLGGMGIVLYARRKALRAHRAARAPLPVGKNEKRAKKSRKAR